MTIYSAFTILTAVAAALGALWERPASRTVVRAAAVVLAVLAAAYLGAHSDPPRAFGDFLTGYVPAGRNVLAAPQHLYDVWPGGFVNLPIVAWLYVPFAALPTAAACALVTVLGIAAAVAACVGLIALTGAHGWRRYAIVAAFVLDGPLYNGLREGNSSVLVLPILVALLASLRARREVAVGVLVALAAIVKPPLALFGVYLLLRGRSRAAAVAIGAAAFVVGVSVALFGVELHRIWFERTVLAFAHHPLAAFNVVSIDGLLARLAAPGHLYDWTPLTVGPQFAALHQLALAAVVLPVGVVLWAVGRALRPAAIDLEFTIVLLVALAISPIAWSHYLAWLLIPIALVAGGAVRLRPAQLAVAAPAAWFAALPVFWTFRFEHGIGGLVVTALPTIGVLALLAVALAARTAGFRLTAFTGALAGTLGLLAAITVVLIAGLHTGRFETVLGSSVQVLHAHPTLDDSWHVMLEAFDDGRAHPGARIYDDVFFRSGEKFQYPLSSLLPLVPLAWLESSRSGASGAALDARISVDLMRISWICVVATIALSAWLLVDGITRLVPRLRSADRLDAAVRAVLAAALGLLFYPLVKGYQLGQIQVWIDVLFAAATVAWWRGMPRTSGICVGFMCWLKPQYVIIVLWAALRRRWAFCLGALAGAIPGVLLALAVYRPANLFGYVRVLGVIGRTGEAIPPNQSVNGIVNRLVQHGADLVWHDHAFPRFNTAVYVATVVSSLLLLALLALNRPRRADRLAGTADFFAAALTATIASPIAWEHHYGILLPIFALLVPIALARAPFGRATAPLLVASYAACATFVFPTLRFASGPASVLQANLFFGALIVLALAHAVVYHARPAAVRAASQTRTPLGTLVTESAS